MADGPQAHDAGFGVLPVVHGQRQLAHLHRKQQRIEIVRIRPRSVETHGRDHLDDIENAAEIGGGHGTGGETGGEIGDCGGGLREPFADAPHGARGQVLQF